MSPQNNKGLVYKKCWPRKNLGELLNFLERMHPGGLALNKISAKLGLSPSGISGMFIRDDMKLSKAEEIINKYGYELHLYFPVRTFFNDYTIPDRGEIPFKDAGNLQGLVKYIYDSNWSINYVCDRYGLSRQMLYGAFKKGDIRISNLYKITDALGICFFWKYEKINN